MTRSYRLISSDSHVTEPGDLWVKRVPAAMRDRAPRIARLERGDAWIMEGMKDPISFGLSSCAGLKPEETRAWVRFEEIRAGGYDPAARIAEQDQDGVDAEVLYPTPRLHIGIAAHPEEAYHLAMVRAYNDWMSEFAGYDPDRFGGLAILPNRGGAGRSAGRNRAGHGPARHARRRTRLLAPTARSRFPTRTIWSGRRWSSAACRLPSTCR